MGIVLESVLLRSSDPAGAAAMWAAVLDRAAVHDGDEVLLPGSRGQLGLRFAYGAHHEALKNRLHLHLSFAGRSQYDTIAASISAGGRLLGSGHVPVDSYAVMADPAGDEFCVIEDQNRYLAGCGPLGEVTCEGTRAVGRFWSAALDWPMVWEDGEETAVQSPDGGTKVAWSGDPVDPARDNARQAFVVTAAPDELDAELARLAALGASDVEGTGDGSASLRDPDGVAFSVRTRIR